MLEGILQQLGLTAFTTACRCHHLSPLLLAIVTKDCLDVFHLSACVAQAELTEEPRLQVVALLSTLLAETMQHAFQLVDRTQCLLHLSSVIFPQAMELRILELPPPDICFLAFPHPRPTGMIGFEVRDRFFLLCLYRFQLLMRFVQSLPLLHVADALIDVGDLGLVRLEISVGLEIVIDCRHEVRPVAASGNLSAVTGYVPQSTVLPYDYHAKHLAFGYLRLKAGIHRSLCKGLLFVATQISRQLHDCQLTKRIRLVIERIVQPDRWLHGCIKRMEYHSFLEECRKREKGKRKN